MKEEDLVNILDLVSLKEIYLLANTPLYLYKHFKRNPSIQILSKKYDLNEIKKIFCWLVKQPRSIDRLACIYSLIIALSFKLDHNTRLFIMNLSKFKVEWLKELSENIIASFIVTQDERIDMQFKINDYFNDRAMGVLSNYKTINM